LEPNAQLAAPGPSTGDESAGDAASSIPKDFAAPRMSPDLGSNDAEPAHHSPPAVSPPENWSISPHLSHHRESTSLPDETIDYVGMRVALYLTAGFVIVLVSMSYYAIFGYLVGGSREEHAGNHGIDDPYDNPELYRKLHERGAAE
jgi:hypothetical protein